MAKAQASTSNSAPQSQPPKKRAQAFEIDDIFASKKSKPTLVAPSASSVAPPTEFSSSSKKNKKNKKNKGKGKATAPSTDEDAMDVEVEQEQDEDADMKSIGDAIKLAKKAVNTQRVPETIVDSSSMIEAYRPAPPAAALGKKRKAGETVDEADERFMDSRGTSEFTIY
jgi:hypothetical protein